MEPVTNPIPKSQTKSASSGSKKAAAAATSQKNIHRKSFEMELAKLVSDIQQYKENMAKNSKEKSRNKEYGKCKKENEPEQTLVGMNSGDDNSMQKDLQEKCSSVDGSSKAPQETAKNKMPKSGLQKRVKVLKEKGVFKKKIGSNLNAVLSVNGSGGKSEKEKQSTERLGKLVSKRFSAEFCSVEDQLLNDKNSSKNNKKKKKKKKKEAEASEQNLQYKNEKPSTKDVPKSQATENKKLASSCQKSYKDIDFKQSSSSKNGGTDSFATRSNNNRNNNNNNFGKKKVDKGTVASEVGHSKASSTKGKKSKEVLGSYSQLLKSIDEPLFYHSAEEIAFLLSPMACKGGPNQRNSSGWRNGENFSHNRQNQRSAFHPNHSQQVNRNLGYDPQNSSPAQKNSYHNQNFKNNNKQNSNESFLPFEDYWPIDQQNFQNPNLIVGQIRVNPKDYQECYVPHPDGHSDVFICGMKNRNRSLNGDIVVVLLDNQSKWRVNKEEFDSDFNPNCDNCDNTEHVSANGTRLANNTQTTASTSNTDYLDQFQRLTLMTKTQTSITNETNNAAALNSFDPNVKKQPKKKETLSKKYTCIADLHNDDNLQKVLANKSGEDHLSHKYIQRTGKVVAISEKKHSRLCVGHLQLMNNSKVKFNPTDSRLPRIMIPISECPKEFLHRPETFSKVLFVAKLKDWGTTDTFASGSLLKKIGEAGQIDTETEGILIENDIDFSEFPEESLKSLPLEVDQPWTIPSEEYSKRRDFTKTCVFTIDPESARDLDDAVSCDKLENGLYEIGVHIADVTYFLTENTQLDEIAASRATSVYLVQKVIPMLPRVLCEQLCSLNPGEPRLTFSVVWHMNDKAEIVDEWFGRSVINSCAKLSYAHAQGFLDDPLREYTKEQLPKIRNFSVKDIKERILIVHSLARILQKRRFDNGALRLDQVKLQWVLHEQTGLPTGTSVYEQKDSNRLIEEFMLLANMAVAHRIYKTFPDESFLRRHPEPQTKMIENLNDLCQNLGIPIDISSAGTINKSLKKYLNVNNDDEYVTARMQVLVAMCSKPMKLALYFCTGILKDESKFWHYALNVPLYTHFTSPIRRYADVIVHRLLAAALDYSPLPQMSMEDMEKQAKHCNDKKSNSKRAQELSNEIFFAAFVKEVGPLHEKGMVMSVLDHAFDVFILKYAIVKRVYCNKLNLVDHVASKKKKIPILTLHWKMEGKSVVAQEICVFTLVNCILETDTEPLRWTAVIKPPKL